MREQQVSVKAKLFALLFLALAAVLLAPSGCATNTQEQPETGPPVEAGPPNPCGPGSAKQCNGTCVDVMHDTQNCGDCGSVCPADKAFCSGGTCASVCGGGTAHCGNLCVDLKSDPLNCGGCGTKCASGQVCNKAACALTCQDSLTDCNGGCVDTTSDDFNCGACGNACAGGKSCVNSSCQATCQSGWSSCSDGTDGGTTCVDTTNDPNNCNSCGNKCPSGYFCQNGVCGIQCAGGTTKCGNACVDEGIDTKNCGGCGTTCTTNYSCSNAHCCPPATPVYCGGCDTFTNCVTKSGGRISAGYEHTCAINAAGATYCWGYNGSGQVGTGSTTTYEYNTAQAALTLTSNTLMLAAGEEHQCAVTGGGAAYCWGYGGYGQVGNGTNNTVYSPATVSGFTSGATRVAAGGYYASAILSSGGAIKTDGYDYEGLLMLGSVTFSQFNTPQTTKITSGAINVGGGPGGYSMCAVTGSGSVQCWGYASYGLGDGSTTISGLADHRQRHHERDQRQHRLLRHLRGHRGGSAEVLGLRRLRRPRHRQHDELDDARHGDALGRHPGVRRLRPHVRAHEQRRGQLRRLQHVRRARQRLDDDQHVVGHAGRERRGRRHVRLLPHVRAHELRQGGVLGLQLRRRVRQRQLHDDLAVWAHDAHAGLRLLIASPQV